MASLNLALLFTRFIYIRYALGLVTHGRKLFHKIVCVVTCTFIVQHLLIFPVRQAWTQNLDKGENVKVQICRHKLTTWLEDREFSVKPKLIVLTIIVLFILAVMFFSKSSSNQKKKYCIPKVRYNVITLELHVILFQITLFIFIVDQIINGFLQKYYESLGVKKVFWIWFMFQFLNMTYHAAIWPILILRWEMIKYCLMHYLTPLQEFPKLPRIVGISRPTFPQPAFFTDACSTAKVGSLHIKKVR